MMSDAIQNFNKQFRYNPKIEGKLKRKKRVVVLGMGGSHLAADLIIGLDAKYDIKVHSDYGLPFFVPTAVETLPNKPNKDVKNTLFIASSYSGNTEEVVDGLNKALKQDLNTAVIATGGKLIEIAKEKNLPYVQMPDDGIQPRSALGYSLRALLKVIGLFNEFKKTGELKKTLKPKELESAGKELAGKLKGSAPVIYASARNKAVAYNWKIKFNETGKIPAFCNVLPELNHNEMTGFSAQSGSASGGDVSDAQKLMEMFSFIFLKDNEDDARNIKRLEILKKLYQDRGLPVELIEMTGGSRWQKVFSSLVLADWTAFYTAQNYGLESEQVPMVEEFKQSIKAE